MRRAPRTPRGPAIPLTAVPKGQVVKVCFFSLRNGAAGRLRDVGLREGSLIHLIRRAGRVIVGIEGSRVGVPADLAVGVFVQEVPQDDHAERPKPRRMRLGRRLGW
jgi:Fe2+ transport system protein FeoA